VFEKNEKGWNKNTTRAQGEIFKNLWQRKKLGKTVKKERTN